MWLNETEPVENASWIEIEKQIKKIKQNESVFINTMEKLEKNKTLHGKHPIGASSPDVGQNLTHQWLPNQKLNDS